MHHALFIGGLHKTSSKHDCANYDRFVPNFDMAYKTIKHVSAPNLKSFDQRKQSCGQKKLDNFRLCYMGKWAREHSLAHRHGCRNINV